MAVVIITIKSAFLLINDIYADFLTFANLFNTFDLINKKFVVFFFFKYVLSNVGR